MSTRFEIKLSAERRAQLGALADEAGLSSAALARLAILQLLDQRAVRLPVPAEQRSEAA
jgi:predicted transcriptional regulator